MPRTKSDATRALDAQRATAWNKSHTRRIAFALNTDTDADLIAHLEKQPSMQGYLKDLIRKDMRQNLHKAEP